MGCLNSEGQFSHWFGNVHLSGPCNRSCYFCIGQHMMALDSYNNLKKWPLENVDAFVDECIKKRIAEVNVTGTNTDPLLYAHTQELAKYLRNRLGPETRLGVRTNGALVLGHLDVWRHYDKASVTVCSFDRSIYNKMMGPGEPPDLAAILAESGHMSDVKVNVVLGPENADDVFETIVRCIDLGIKKINLREPYGQPHVGDPMKKIGLRRGGFTLGMPTYPVADGRHGHLANVTYWDVHYVEVESVNLYANGIISTTYPITKGHHPTGEVKDQSSFPGGRVREQWQRA